MSLTIQQFSLRDFLAGPSEFVMARYQRHYEWTRLEMSQLLADLDDASERGRGRPSGGYHFFNSIIVYPEQGSRFQVVDGQQRLTSLALVLAAARAVTLDPLTREAIDGALRSPTGSGSRLTLHRGDDNALRPLLLDPAAILSLPAVGRIGERPGTERLWVNARLALDWMRGYGEAERTVLVRFILENTRFARILVEDEDEAFRIFEIVNSRGRDIAAEDVLRYALIEYATTDTDRRSQLLAMWDRVEAELGASGMKRYISSWKARATGGERARGPLHKVVLSTFGSPGEAQRFLETELAGDVAIYREIDEADVAIPPSPEKTRIDAALASMHLLQTGEQMGEWLPGAIMIIEAFRNSPAEMRDAMVALERRAWYYYVCADVKARAEDRQSDFARVVQTMTRGADLSRLIARLRLDQDEQKRMFEKFAGRIDNKWMPLRSLLVLLEMHLSGLTRRIARSSVTVEHVLPLSATRKGWTDQFGSDPDRIAAYALSIGNLCLVPSAVNRELGDKIYRSKRKIILAYDLAKTSALAADIATTTDWTPDVIGARSARFVDTLSEVFGIDPAIRRTWSPPTG
ncbi:MAG TPA: DUF262 domain-containing HNH endonuclease family protein [Hyphomicrobiaceae bacterium]|nr:DUF262 domain-containing HNH endonuclease family protein [Hyphomicrobiaceae bacterium]